VGFTTLHDDSTTRDATQFRDAWAPHTQTQRHGALAMMTRPYKPRDSAFLSYLSYLSILSYLVESNQRTLSVSRDVSLGRESLGAAVLVERPAAASELAVRGRPADPVWSRG
jgi:hypothetical protein